MGAAGPSNPAPSRPQRGGERPRKGAKTGTARGKGVRPLKLQLRRPQVLRRLRVVPPESEGPETGPRSLWRPAEARNARRRVAVGPLPLLGRYLTGEIPSDPLSDVEPFQRTPHRSPSEQDQLSCAEGVAGRTR